LQNSKLGDAYVVEGDKFSLNKCLKNDLEKKNMKKIRYASAIGDYWDVRQIFK